MSNVTKVLWALVVPVTIYGIATTSLTHTVVTAAISALLTVGGMAAQEKHKQDRRAARVSV